MLLSSLTAVLLSGCAATPPDRQEQVAKLADEIGHLPGVIAVSSKATNLPNQGRVNFTIDAETTVDIGADELAAIATRYLRGLREVDFSGYRTEFDAHHGWNVFAIDGGRLPIVNDDEIVAQARDWARLRHDFPTATVTLRANIAHPGGRHPIQEWGHFNTGSIQLAERADYRDATVAITTLTDRYPELAALTWTVSAGVDHPADIKSTHRYPSSAELALWAQVNADQAIPHLSKLTIGGRVSAPVWLAEKTASHDQADAERLARRHLPLVAALPGPTLLTATDHIQGDIDGDGHATGPIAITTGGCTDRVYRPPATEQALINTYETCKKY
ncbi:hypothetical protein SBI67_20060 [Mycolicibacterium sp. 120266]|uniref:hypothetical protein n=1 Tax=Mycolicibacterium sp. 120266 TaxID=3090601 RepID=UPI00299DCC00|nr:hypothetical protein [Mycolicibacterium sp. 120266]MDX1874420.1 hypothetical protein [Mycolicibacterium sp. 120266]